MHLVNDASIGCTGVIEQMLELFLRAVREVLPLRALGQVGLPASLALAHGGSLDRMHFEFRNPVSRHCTQYRNMAMLGLSEKW